MASPIGLRRLRANRQAIKRFHLLSLQSPSWLSVSPHNDHILYPVLWQTDHYYFMVGLPYHRIILGNIDQFESLSIVHTDAIACVAFRSSVIGWNLHNRCDSRTFDRMKLNMFNLCDPERNRCRMYGCTCSCSCMYVYTVRSSRRSVTRPIAATIAQCKHRVTRQRTVVSTLSLMETFIARGETCDALSRSVGQLNRK